MQEEDRDCPSFRRLSLEDCVESPKRISAANPPTGQEDEDDDDSVQEDFEFAFVLRDPESGPRITADEIFSNGQIRPVYPVFNRDLLLSSDDGGREKAIRLPLRRLFIEEERESGSSSSLSSSSSSMAELDDLEGIPPGTYCVWTPKKASPSPDRCKKSSSTGSSLRWRLRDLVIGRSHSDGKEKFVFLAAEEKKAKGPAVAEEENKKGMEKGKKDKKPTEVDIVTAHRMYYGRSHGQGGQGVRRSFLPYKQDIFGFFANVNGLSRTHHPF